MKPIVTNKKKQKDIDYITRLAQNYANNEKKDVYVFKIEKQGIGVCFDFSEEKHPKTVVTVRFDRRPARKTVLQDNGDRELEPIEKKERKGKREKTGRNLGELKRAVLEGEGQTEIQGVPKETKEDKAT